MSSYQEKFEEMDNSELLELAKNYDQLNEEAKYSLYKVLKSRSEIDSDKYSDLNMSVQDYFSKIDNLTYLKNIGFSHVENDSELIIKRSTKASIWDIVGVVLGVLLMISFGPAISDLKTLFSNGFNSSLLIVVSINLFFGVLGFFIFYKGLNRLIEYSGFKIVKSRSGISIYKQGVTKIESVLTNSDLYLEVDDEKTVIGINSDDKTPLIISKENSLFRATLESLYKKLSK